MAMNIAGMAAAIEAQLATPIANPAQFALALATAIVAYIQSNAVASVVTACPAGAGTGTGPVT